MEQRQTKLRIAALLLTALAWGPWASAQQEQKQIMSNLKVGNAAPDFTLPDQNNKPVKLSDFRGKKQVVLAFYVLAFTSG